MWYSFFSLLHFIVDARRSNQYLIIRDYNSLIIILRLTPLQRNCICSRRSVWSVQSVSGHFSDLINNKKWKKKKLKSERIWHFQRGNIKKIQAIFVGVQTQMENTQRMCSSLSSRRNCASEKYVIKISCLVAQISYSGCSCRFWTLNNIKNWSDSVFLAGRRW